MLCDNTYVFDVYLYTGRRGHIRRTGTCAGNLDAKGIMRWTVLVADLFFGSHGLAEYFVSINRPFLTLSKHNKKDEALTDARQRLAEGQVACGVIKAHGYELVVFKKCQGWAQAPPRLVPCLRNCWFGESEVQSRGRQPLSPVVACYREFSRAVDGANQMALQLRIMTRQMTWASAVCVFMLRYAAVNAFAACKALGLVERGTTMWEFQWDIIRHRDFAGPKWCALTM